MNYRALWLVVSGMVSYAAEVRALCTNADCDGGGIANDEDLCPSLKEQENKGSFGFQDFACYETWVVA